ncbi:MAG: hypothetical protein K2H35_05820 [Muribaculaceae bacterium]|nr:hypothetical protein [Muribaculaceae bacterium]
MKKFIMLLFIVAATSTPFFAQTATDSIPSDWEKEFDLNEVVVVANKPVLKQEADRIIYLTKNDPHALTMH